MPPRVTGVVLMVREPLFVRSELPMVEVATTWPVALVVRSALGVPMMRFVVEAVPKNPSPETEKTEVEAVMYPLLIPHALAEVVENASPWLRARKLVALVVEKARFWLRERKLVAEVVLNAAP